MPHRPSLPGRSRRAFLVGAAGGIAASVTTILAACGGAAAVSSGSVTAELSGTGAATTAAAITKAASTAASGAATTSASSAAASTTVVAAQSGAKAATTVDFWLVDQSPDVQKLYQDQVLPDLQKALPNLRVTMGWKDWSTGAVGIDQAITAAWAGSVAPDIFQWGASYVFRVAHLNMGVVVDKMLDQWGTRDDFFAASLQTCQWNGKTYGLPYLTSPRTYYGRGDLLKSAGIDAMPSTWEEQIDTAVKMNKIDSGQLQQLGVNTTPDPQEFAEFILSLGGNLIVGNKTAVQSPEGQLAAQFIMDRYQRITPPGTKALAAAPSGVAQFTLGRQIMSWGGPSVLQNVATKAPDAVADILVGKPVVAGGSTYRAPDPSKVRPMAESFTDWLIITTQSKHPDDAFDVLKVVLTGKDLLDYNQQFYYIPPRKSVASQGFMAQPKNQEVVKVYDQYGVGAASPIVPDGPRFRELLTNALTDIANKKVGVQDALTQVAQAYDPVIASSGWGQ